MLYTINQPTYTQHLEWIVCLQRDLLRLLCDPNIVATAITNDWVRTQRPDVESDWIERFCGWSIEGKSMLARMQAIAVLLPADKQVLITHYEINLRYLEAFDHMNPQPPATTPLPANLSAKAASAYSDFFEMFYAPIFYEQKGYPINATDLNGEQFTRGKFLATYHAANSNLKVCPLCDGGMDGAELDHWLAKKHLPELNCHPQNLVEICSACNKRTNKGEKLVLDKEVSEPFSKWFHPYLRPAANLFRIDRQGRRIRLVSPDANTQERLDNLDSLVNLGSRWSHEWLTQIKRVETKIRGALRRGQTLDEDNLRIKIEAWKNEAEDDIRLNPHALIEAHILSLAQDENSDEFEEFRSYARDGMLITHSN